MKSAWARVASIALMYDVQPRGYLPIEVIAMLKLHYKLFEADEAKLREICKELGFEYDNIKPRFWIRR